jgi:Matrixin
LVRHAALLVAFSPGLVAFFAQGAIADVIVVANRSPVVIQAQLKPILGAAQNVTLAPGDVEPVFVDGRAYIQFSGGNEAKRYLLDANSAYYFGKSKDGRIDLEKIGLGDDKTSAEGRTLPGRAATAPLAVIPVKILVDEEEPARRSLWERRLRERIAAASDVLEKQCRVQLKVVAVDTWKSDDATTDFFDSLAEFERKVKPFPAQLAIGFTSQYQVVTGRVHMAGTRGTLHTHILVREWSRHMSEPERLELLVHELGHFLGASHSPERDSVMRPVLGDRQAVRAGFHVRFDPVNTLVMSLVGEEIRRRRIQHVSELSPGTMNRLRQIYQALSPTMPKDPAANQYVQNLNVSTAAPLVMGTKQVLAQVVSSAQSNSRLPLGDGKATDGKTRREGDALTEHLVRQAAGIARFLPESIATNSFLLGLGIALDDSNTLRSNPKFGGFVRIVESDQDRARRLAALGAPTMLGRRDLAQHFFISAHLTATVGSRAAVTLGTTKELSDANGGSGFSFADVAANRAGALFAGGVINKRFSLVDVADNFRVPVYMPSISDLPEGLTTSELTSQFGTQQDGRFQQQLQQIDQRLLQLPPYRESKVTLERKQ